MDPEIEYHLSRLKIGHETMEAELDCLQKKILYLERQLQSIIETMTMKGGLR